MKKLIILTTSIIFLMVFVVPFTSALFIKMIPTNDQPGYYARREIYGFLSVSQEFTAKSNNLTAIGTSLGNPNLKNQKKINLTIFDSENKVVRDTSLNGFSVGDGAFVKFEFEPITDSESKKYTFVLSSPDANSEQVLYIFVSNDPSDWIGPATYGEETLTNGMPIVTYYKPGSHAQVARDIAASWIKRILGK